jgi:hypothetical protein
MFQFVVCVLTSVQRAARHSAHTTTVHLVGFCCRNCNSKFKQKKYLILLLTVQCLILRPFHSVIYSHQVSEEGTRPEVASVRLSPATYRISTKFCLGDLQHEELARFSLRLVSVW